MRKQLSADSDAARFITGAVILLLLCSGVLADQNAVSSYLEACELLHKGEPRAESARRFAAAATAQLPPRGNGTLAGSLPAGRIGNIAASLAELLKQMAVEDQAFQEPKNPAALTGQQRIDYLIFKLRDVAAQSPSIPGKTDVLFYPQIPDSPVLALRKIGKSAVPSLLALLEDMRPTRSYSGLMNGQCILRYNDVALQILERIAGRRFDPQTVRGGYLSTADAPTRAKIMADVKGWWEKNRQRDEGRWLREALEEDSAGPMWDHLAAADRLIELQGAGSVDLFRQRLAKDPNNPHVIGLLWKAGGKTVLGDIRPLADSKVRPLREPALRALVAAGEPDAVRMIVQMLDALPAEDPGSATQPRGETVW